MQIIELTCLQKWMLLVILGIVEPEALETSFRLLTLETIFATSEKLENLVNFQIYL